MAVHLANAVARAACDTINHQIDLGGGGTGRGFLRVYAGARPAAADTPLTTQTLLIEFKLPNPTFQAAVKVGSTGTATAFPVDPVTAKASGTASFFQVLNSDAVVIFDGDVTDTAGNGDLKLSTVAVVQGIDVTVVSLTAIMPEL